MRFFLVFLFLISCQNFNSNTYDVQTYGPSEATGSTAFQAAYAILQNRCASCHTHSDWGNFKTEEDWVSHGYVVRGSPASSPVLTRIINYGANDSTMPQDGSALPTDEYQKILTWVQSVN